MPAAELLCFWKKMASSTTWIQRRKDALVLPSDAPNFDKDKLESWQQILCGLVRFSFFLVCFFAFRYLAVFNACILYMCLGFNYTYPLHLAVSQKNVDITNLLLEPWLHSFSFSSFFKGTQLFAAKDCGADPTVQDSSGYTAFQLAVLKDPTSKAKESWKTTNAVFVL